ncbi:MAG: hypothetical protein HC896_12915, partial [Bacteroidales bacterium]|nr:hypothetical protein [Bacteroidales bacterium]
ELQNLNATKDKFFSIIAHDLKNPFNNILGLVDILVERYETFQPEKMKEWLELVNESARSGYELLNNLLNWANAQTGRMKFSPLPLPANDVIEKVISILSLQAANKRLNCTMVPCQTKKLWPILTCLPQFCATLLAMP